MMPTQCFAIGMGVSLPPGLNQAWVKLHMPTIQLTTT
jgi:hypothetical protein